MARPAAFSQLTAKLCVICVFLGRSAPQIKLVEEYAKAQFMWRDESHGRPDIFGRYVEIELGKIEPSLAGPKRPQDRVALG